MNAILTVPTPHNEPVLEYAPGSPERRALRAALDRMAGEVVEITPRIAGERVPTGRTAPAVMPHDHRHVLATWHKAGPAEAAGQRIQPARLAPNPAAGSGVLAHRSAGHGGLLGRRGIGE